MQRAPSPVSDKQGVYVARTANCFANRNSTRALAGFSQLRARRASDRAQKNISRGFARLSYKAACPSAARRRLSVPPLLTLRYLGRPSLRCRIKRGVSTGPQERLYRHHVHRRAPTHPRACIARELLPVSMLVPSSTPLRSVSRLARVLP